MAIFEERAFSDFAFYMLKLSSGMSPTFSDELPVLPGDNSSLFCYLKDVSPVSRLSVLPPISDLSSPLS